MLSLPISAAGDDNTSLRDDASISRFLYTDTGDAQDRSKGGVDQPSKAIKSTNNDGLETPRSGSPRPTTAGLRSPTSLMNSSMDGSYPSRRSAENVVEDLRGNVLREMKEKEALLTKYETLSRQHIQLEDRLAKKSAEAPREVDLSQNEDHKQLLLSFEALGKEHREVKEQLMRKDGEMARKEQEMAKKTDELRAAAETQQINSRQSTEDPNQMEEQVSNARLLIRHHEEENERLRKQNLELRQGTSMPHQINGVTSDSDLKAEMANLSADVQNWILNNFRKYKLGESIVTSLGSNF